MNLEDVNQLLEPGYLPMETGFTRLPNNDIYIAVLTRMPRCKGKMIDWWFGLPATQKNTNGGPA